MSGYPTFMSLPPIDELSTDPQVLGRHKKTFKVFFFKKRNTSQLLLKKHEVFFLRSQKHFFKILSNAFYFNHKCY